jgi:hypothetical protein
MGAVQSRLSFDAWGKRATETLYLLKDHLGSTDVITDALLGVVRVRELLWKMALPR